MQQKQQKEEVTKKERSAQEQMTKAIEEHKKVEHDRKELKERENNVEKREQDVLKKQQEIKNRDKVFDRKLLDIIAPNMDGLMRDELLNDGDVIAKVRTPTGKIVRKYMTIETYIGLRLNTLKKVRSNTSAPVVKRKSADERLAHVEHEQNIDWDARFGNPALVNKVKRQQKQHKKVQQDDELEL